MRRAKEHLGPGQILIASILGTPAPGDNPESLIADYTRCAVWSAEAGLYATATWIPAYVLLVWPIANGRPWLRVRLIAAPFCALACVVGVVVAVYVALLAVVLDAL